MKNSKISVVMITVLALVLMMSPVAYAAPGEVISNSLNATFEVTVSTEKSVANLVELKAALENTNITTINITADISGITERIVVDRAVTINGGNKILTFTDAINDLPYGSRHGIIISANGVTINNLTVVMTEKAVWQGTYGIQVYGVNNVTINNYKGTKADAALLVNGSQVTLTGSIDVSGNEFGGIEVSKGSGVITDPLLTVSNVTTFTNNTEAYELPTIWEDKVTGKVIGADKLISISGIKTDQVQYYLPSEVSAALSWDLASGTINATTGQKLYTDVNAILTNGSIVDSYLVIEVKKDGITNADVNIDEDGGNIEFVSSEAIVDNTVIFTSSGIWINDKFQSNYDVGFTFNKAGIYYVNAYLIEAK